MNFEQEDPVGLIKEMTRGTGPDRVIDAVGVDANRAPEADDAEFEQAIRALPQVTSATLMTGSFDYALRVECTSRAELVEVTESIRHRAGAMETYSRVILREVSLKAIG